MAENKGKKTKWAEVSCEIHGKEMANNPWKRKQVKVAIPRSKRERMSGCPECNKLKPKNQTLIKK
jgi:hypothetical protein